MRVGRAGSREGGCTERRGGEEEGKDASGGRAMETGPNGVSTVRGGGWTERRGGVGMKPSESSSEEETRVGGRTVRRGGGSCGGSTEREGGSSGGCEERGGGSCGGLTERGGG